MPMCSTAAAGSPQPGRFPADIDAESHGRYIGIILVSVFRLDGVEKMFDKCLESQEDSGCGLKFSHRHAQTSILNG